MTISFNAHIQDTAYNMTASPPEMMIKNIPTVLLVTEGCGELCIFIWYAVGLSQIALFV